MPGGGEEGEYEYSQYLRKRGLLCRYSYAKASQTHGFQSYCCEGAGGKICVRNEPEREGPPGTRTPPVS